MPPKKSSTDEFMAAAIGDLHWLKQCLKDSPRGDTPRFDKNGLAAVHLAAIHGRLDCIKFLIGQQKVDIDLGSSTGWRPVHLSISNQTGRRALACLTYLIEKGADPSITNDDGITPAHQAASEGHFDCLKLLLAVGARIDAKDCRGNLPIDLARLWGHRNSSRILANAMWHQEKEGVATEMRQLKKERIREVLTELEQAEALMEEQKFFGKEAFEEWLEGRKEEKKIESREATRRLVALSAAKAKASGKSHRKTKSAVVSVPPSKPGRSEETKKKEDTPLVSKIASEIGEDRSTDDKLSTIQSEEGVVSPVPSGEAHDWRAQEAGREHVPEDRRESRLRFQTDEMEKLAASPAEMPQPEERPVAPKMPSKQPVPTIHHPSHWNSSTHVTPCFHAYQPGLGDLYPRDIYTMEPLVWSTPAELNPKTQELAGRLFNENDHLLIQQAARERQKSPGDVKNKGKSEVKKPPPFRVMYYRSKTILDVPTRSKSADVEAPRPEVPLHLISDPSSYLFRCSILPSVLSAEVPGSREQSRASSTRSTTSSLHRGHVTREGFPSLRASLCPRRTTNV